MNRWIKTESSRRMQSVQVTAARMLGYAIVVAVPIVVVRVLDQSTFGNYKQLFLIAETLVSLFTIGLPASLWYLVPRAPQYAQRLFVQTSLILGGLGAVGAAVLLLAGPWVGRLFDAPLDPYFGWLSLYVALAIPGSLLYVTLMIDRRARLAGLSLAGLDVLRGALIVTAAAVTGDLKMIIIAGTIALAVQLAALVVYLAWRRRQDSWETHPGLVRDQLAYALPFAGTAMIGLTRDKAHAYFVAANFSVTQFAIYAVALLNIPFLGYISQTVAEVVILENAGHFKAGRRDEMRRVWYRASYMLALVLLPIFIVLEVFASEVITTLFGIEYIASVPLFRAYLCIMPLSILLSSPMLRATGDLRLMLVADIASLAVTIAVLVATVGRLGPMGAVLSLLAGQATFIVIASVRSATRLGLNLGNFMPWGSVLGVVATAAVASIVPFMAMQGLHPTLRLLLGGPVAAALYAGLAWRFGLVPESERAIVRRSLARFTRSRPAPAPASDNDG